jgi:hypothetical protein
MPELILAGTAGGAALALAGWLLARERAGQARALLPVRSKTRPGSGRRG